MNLPSLMPKVRNREFSQYSKVLRDNVIYLYLFKGKSHRWMDEKVLGKNAEMSKGYQSMGILHHIGLLPQHKNIFHKFTLEQAKEYVQGKSQEYAILLSSLELKSSAEIKGDYVYEIHEQDYQYKVDQKIAETKVEYLINHIDEEIPRSPKQKVLNSEGNLTFGRSIYEATRALIDAQFFCEISENHCSFISKKTRKNYVEAHHLIPISFQDDFQFDIDQVANLVALCPNCHKKIHLSLSSDKQLMLKELYLKRKERLVNIGIDISERDLLKMYDI